MRKKGEEAEEEEETTPPLPKKKLSNIKRLSISVYGCGSHLLNTKLTTPNSRLKFLMLSICRLHLLLLQRIVERNQTHSSAQNPWIQPGLYVLYIDYVTTSHRLS